MPDVKVTGKKTITGKELGASEMPAVLLHKDAYGNTRQEKLDEHKRAVAGVEVIDKKVLNKNALLRGTFLEHAIVPWWLETLKEDGMECQATEPEKAFRLEEEKLGATLDRILKVPAKCELVINDQVLKGKGVLEVKTDFYHTGKCKPDWMIQVHQQMMCADLPWAVVLVMTQQGKLVTYAFKRDMKLCNQILQAAREFWDLLEKDRDYPPAAPAEEEKLKVVTVEGKQGDNLDLEVVATDCMKAKAESRHWSKIAKDNQEILELHMDSIGADVMNVGSYQIKSVTTQKPKRTMVDVPGQFIDSTSFSIKEVTNE
jgi:hypothetical protein